MKKLRVASLRLYITAQKLFYTVGADIIRPKKSTNCILKKYRKYCRIVKNKKTGVKLMAYTYRTKGTCSRSISFEIVDGKVKNVRFEGGCNGNLKGIAALVDGMKPEEVIERVEGIRCGFKNTSCPDQLAKALREVKENG